MRGSQTWFSFAPLLTTLFTHKIRCLTLRINLDDNASSLTTVFGFSVTDGSIYISEVSSLSTVIFLQHARGGMYISYDQEALHVAWLSGLRSCRRRIRSFINDLLGRVFPVCLTSLAFSVWSYNAMYFTRDTCNHGIDLSFGFIDFLKKYVKLEEPA